MLMSKEESNTNQGGDVTQELREEFAAAFNRPTDPLEEYSREFDGLPDPFDYFLMTVVTNRDGINTEDTIEGYRRTYRQWRGHMASTDRHPACPSIEHIKAFVRWRRDVHGNTRDTILIKLSHLRQAYEHWQKESVFPHPAEYKPFEVALDQISLGDQEKKPFPELSLEDLQERFARVQNIRDRAIIGTQLKCGLRAGEMFNFKLQDIHLSHNGLHICYPELGTHPAIGDYTDVLYVPPDRDGNKSNFPRLIPVDEELRWLLIRHLLTRPQVDEPWVFLSRRSFTKLSYTGINNPWKAAFHPEFGESEDRRSVTSHFGRHWFSSYWRLVAGLDREHVQYMRGDRIEPLDEFADAIDDYLHPNYNHIESDYRNHVFKLQIPLTHATQ